MPVDVDGQALDMLLDTGATSYPTPAAAGLWTTPTDLARFVMELQRSLHGEANNVIDENLADEMLIPIKEGYGLGLVIAGSKHYPHFWHDGVNEGFLAKSWVIVTWVREGLS